MLRTHRFLFISTVLLLFSKGLLASPLISIGDSIDIFATGRTGFKYDSNVFVNASASKVDDFIYNMRPGVEIVIGKQSIYGINIKLYEDIDIYFERNELNSYRENLEIEAFYDSGGITSLTVEAAFNPKVQNTGAENVEGALIRRRNYQFDLGATFDVSDKSTITAAINTTYVDFRNFTHIFADALMLDIPINYMYSISPVFEVGAGYHYRYKDYEYLDTNPRRKFADRSDHFFNLRVNGELTAKLFNTTAVGYQIHDVNGGRTHADFSVDTSFTWEATQKLQIKYGASRDYRSTGAGRSIKETVGFFNTSYAVSEKMRVNLVSSYKQVGYLLTDRSDEHSSVGLFYTYVIDAYFNIDVGWQYQNNHSSLDGGSFPSGNGNESNASFNQHIVQFNASVKY